MKSMKFPLLDLPLFENPRSLDRLLTACMVVLAIMVVAMGFLALQQQSTMTRSEQITVEIEMPRNSTGVPAALESAPNAV